MGDNNAAIGTRSIPYSGCYYVDEGLSVVSASTTVASNLAGSLLRTNVDTLQSTPLDWSGVLQYEITTNGTRIKGDSDTSYKACKPKRKHYKPKFTL